MVGVGFGVAVLLLRSLGEKQAQVFCKSLENALRFAEEGGYEEVGV